ncbi:SDR family NAD(P)-dependent oxidoreductase [Pyxidicoccus xibeiensis]|uniref:SDR family NAD(P)-dependent oxidoreductase n=1 Tax=Pyxidicoccus xibeiensis TaxID=2906759 RepID=UPI0020A7EAD4|nr:SDR family oxidoreductase [Pyxidicoccus xibeiensis]MCP3138589.1 SDR family oxidoreductase [Pyxidicoccus xibeiensis]
MSTQNLPVATPIALITGGSRGLGRSMALKLAERGVDVILTYRTAEQEARDVAAQLEARGRKASVLPLDVGRSDGFPAFAEAVRAELARVWKRDRFDILVNNAGSGTRAAFIETTEAQFDEMLNVHLKGPFFLTQKLLPLMADGGRILNVSSGLARYTFPGSSAYAVMKGGVEVLTRYLARELGPRRISVNVVAPGGIETDFGGGVMRDDTLKQMVASQTALGRVGVPDDIGGLVAALLAPESQWMTGQRIEATGGFFL